MPEEIPGTPAPISAPTGLSVPEAAELERLRGVARNYEEFVEAIEPHRGRIEKILSDPEYGDFVDKGFDSYKNIREQSKPKLGPEWSEENNPVIADVKRASKFVSELERERADAAKAKEAQWGQEAVAYADRLQAQDPDLYKALSQDGWGLTIGQWAKGKGKSWEDGVKHFTQNFGIHGRSGAIEAPPPSLPADAATPGVPGESEEPVPTFKTKAERVAWMSKRLARAARRSA